MLPNLKVLRKEYGISQQQLADSIGVSQPSINKYENHNIEPDFDILMRLADYFNTSVDYIIGYTEIRHKIEHIEETYLNCEESHLIRQYRSLKKEQQACITNLIETFSHY